MCRQTDLAGAHVASRLGPLIRSGKPGRVGAHHGRVKERRAQAFAVDAVVLNVALWWLYIIWWGSVSVEICNCLA